MNKRSAGGSRVRSAAAPNRAFRFRWSFLACSIALMLALALKAERAAAATPVILNCEDVVGRDCTTTEDLAICIINSFYEYDDCKLQGGVWNDVECYGKYVVDYWSCYLEIPGNTLFK